MKFLTQVIKGAGRLAEDLLKGPDNKYWDIGRILLVFVGNLLLVAGTIWEVTKQAAFDAAEFGSAFGIINGSGIGAIVLRDKVRTDITLEKKEASEDGPV